MFKKIAESIFFQKIFVGYFRTAKAAETEAQELPVIHRWNLWIVEGW